METYSEKLFRVLIKFYMVDPYKHWNDTLEFFGDSNYECYERKIRDLK